MKDLDQLLNDEQPNDEPQAIEEPAQPEVEVAEQPIEEAPPAPARDEKGRFAPKGVDEGVPPTPDKLPQEEFKALKDERTKRQTLESEVAALRQQLQQLQNPPAPPPSIWEDEQGAFQHFGGQVVNTAVEQARHMSRLETSEMLAAEAFPDFKEVWEPMNAFLSENPVIAQKANADRHPWAYAYRAYKNATTMQELGATDLDALKSKLREELLAEMQAQQPAQPSPPQIPVSISNERNVGQRAGPAWSGPRSLSELLS